MQQIAMSADLAAIGLHSCSVRSATHVVAEGTRLRKHSGGAKSCNGSSLQPNTVTDSAHQCAKAAVVHRMTSSTLSIAATERQNICVTTRTRQACHSSISASSSAKSSRSMKMLFLSVAISANDSPNCIWYSSSSSTVSNTVSASG